LVQRGPGLASVEAGDCLTGQTWGRFEDDTEKETFHISVIRSVILVKRAWLRSHSAGAERTTHTLAVANDFPP
jgi:hypothetical protein